MKTKNAFALRDFDEQKFLQRQLKACGLSDRALIKPDGNVDDFDDLLRTRRAYLDFCDNLFQWRQRLNRHGDRLDRYQAALGRLIATADDDVLKPKSKRTVALSDQYAAIAKTIIDAEKRATVMRDQVDIAQRSYCLKIFARRLKETRKSLRMTQTDFGKVFGLSQRIISNYELGQREPSLAMLKILARISNRPIGWFLEGTTS